LEHKIYLEDVRVQISFPFEKKLDISCVVESGQITKSMVLFVYFSHSTTFHGKAIFCIL